LALNREYFELDQASSATIAKLADMFVMQVLEVMRRDDRAMSDPHLTMQLVAGSAVGTVTTSAIMACLTLGRVVDMADEEAFKTTIAGLAGGIASGVKFHHLRGSKEEGVASFMEFLTAAIDSLEVAQNPTPPKSEQN
jgi:hypothetical protein